MVKSFQLGYILELLISHFNKVQSSRLYKLEYRKNLSQIALASFTTLQKKCGEYLRRN